MTVCSSCGHDNISKAQFCTECGNNISGIKGRIKGASRRFTHTTKQAIDQVKISLDNQISTYLAQIEEGTKVKIAGISVPSSRKSSVRNALESFQTKYLDGPQTNQKDYEEWLSDLPHRLEEHNCIVRHRQRLDQSNQP